MQYKLVLVSQSLIKLNILPLKMKKVVPRPPPSWRVSGGEQRSPLYPAAHPAPELATVFVFVLKTRHIYSHIWVASLWDV